MRLMGIVLRNRCWPTPLFTLLQLEMLTDGVVSELVVVIGLSHGEGGA